MSNWFGFLLCNMYTMGQHELVILNGCMVLCSIAQIGIQYPWPATQQHQQSITAIKKRRQLSTPLLCEQCCQRAGRRTLFMERKK